MKLTSLLPPAAAAALIAAAVLAAIPAVQARQDSAQSPAPSRARRLRRPPSAGAPQPGAAPGEAADAQLSRRRRI